MQVPLLLSLGESERGLVKALESGDSDLVYLALFHMYRAIPLGDFVTILAKRSAARRLFEAYCHRQVRHPPFYETLELWVHTICITLHGLCYQ